MESVTRRRLLRSAGLATAGLVAAACQPKVITQTVVVEKEVERVVKETVVVEKEKVVAAPQEAVTIKPVVMAYFWDEAQQSYLPKFLEEHPNIKVEYIVVPGWGEYPVKVAAMYAAATLGDTVEWDVDATFQTWSYTGVIRVLDDLIEATKFDVDAYYPGPMEGLRYRDHQVGIPYYVHAGDIHIAVNADLLDEFGEPYPPTESWDYNQFVEKAKAATKDSDGDGKTDIWGFHHHTGQRAFIGHLRSNGGQPMDPTSHESWLDRPESIKTLEQIRSAIWEWNVMPEPGTAEAHEVLFRSGKLVMEQRSTSHLISTLKAVEETFNAVPCMMPTSVETGKIGTCIGGIATGVTSLAKRPEEAWEYLQWLGSNWYGVQGFLDGYITPGGRKDTWNDPKVIDHFPFAQIVANALETAEPNVVPWNLRFQEIATTFGTLQSDLLYGKVTADECGQAMATEINKILAKPII
jgi:multiple sugar transport system substrate-binding protein